MGYGLVAYLWWGFVPLYFRAVRSVPADEILAHRVVWSFVLLAILSRWFHRWPVALAALRDRRILLTLLLSTALIAINWLTFIWSILDERLIEASLGYFMSPLVNVALGVVFLRERLRAWQGVSVALATVGVGYLTLRYGQVPWIALILATSFGFYGLVRKTARVDSLVGLTLETMLLAPAMGLYLLVLTLAGDGVFAQGPPRLSLLLVLGGVVTAVPLLCFAAAARRLRLATVGLLQYIAPTFQFFLAVVAFGEPFTQAHAISFTLIWCALAIYSIDAIRASRAPSAA